MDPSLNSLSIHITGHRHHPWHPADKPTQAGCRVRSNERQRDPNVTLTKTEGLDLGRCWPLIFAVPQNFYIRILIYGKTLKNKNKIYTNQWPVETGPQVIKTAPFVWCLCENGWKQTSLMERAHGFTVKVQITPSIRGYFHAWYSHLTQLIFKKTTEISIDYWLFITLMH